MTTENVNSFFRGQFDKCLLGNFRLQLKDDEARGRQSKCVRRACSTCDEKENSASFYSSLRAHLEDRKPWCRIDRGNFPAFPGALSAAQLWLVGSVLCSSGESDPVQGGDLSGELTNSAHFLQPFFSTSMLLLKTRLLNF